jgi:hypothetical protein
VREEKSREMRIRRYQTLIYKDQCTVLVFAWRLKTWTYSIELVGELSRTNESGGSAIQYACEGEKKRVRGQRKIKYGEQRWSMLIFPLFSQFHTRCQATMLPSEKLQVKTPPVALFYVIKIHRVGGFNGNCGQCCLNLVGANCALNIISG